MPQPYLAAMQISGKAHCKETCSSSAYGDEATQMLERGLTPICVTLHTCSSACSGNMLHSRAQGVSACRVIYARRGCSNPPCYAIHDQICRFWQFDDVNMLTCTGSEWFANCRHVCSHKVSLLIPACIFTPGTPINLNDL